MIPNETIDRILDKTDIVEIISGYVPLKKAGQNFKARCPFHEEKTPSFVVSPGKQIYHCFGCGAGGNAIGFLMKHERMDFVEVIKMLADKANVALPRISQDANVKQSFADKLYKVNDAACSIYRGNLMKESGREAYGYLVKRGITVDTMRNFRLGFAEDSWEGLVNLCRTKEIEPDLLEKAGLVLSKKDAAKPYDRFRNRIIFPIFDLRNRVLGFGARVLGESLPKYINSPETYIYRKGRHLYGLNFAKEYVRKQNYVIITEGYLDLILPYQNNIKNVVATLGTALTREQIGLIKRFTKNVIMVYDSDNAGEEATLRGLDLLIEEDMNVRIALLPKGTDPDNFVRKEGKPGFMKVLKDSKDLFDYKLGTLTARFKKSEPHGRSNIVHGMLPTLAGIKDAVLKSGYLKKMSEQLAIDEESIRTELDKIGHGFKMSHAENEGTKYGQYNAPAEIALLALTLEDPSLAGTIEKKLGFEKFTDERIGAVLKKIDRAHEDCKKINPSHLMSYFEDEKTEEIISEALNLSQTMRNKNKAFEDCINHIKKDNLKKVLTGIQCRIKQAESESDIKTVNRLIAEYNELVKNANREGKQNGHRAENA